MRRFAITLVVGVALVATTPAPGAGANPCRVRNVDQGTVGASLKAMAAAANDGDRLRVRGVCRGEVVISSDLSIRGVGDVAVITGQDVRRALRVQPGANVGIAGLVIRDGTAPSGSSIRGGGGIRNRGTLLVVSSLIRDNRAGTGGLGGGILNLGSLALIDATVRDNRASQGGGIASRALAGDPVPTLAVQDSRIRRNRAVNGGGIFNLGVVAIDDTVIARNRAGFGGGGIANSGAGDLDVDGSTIRDNVAGQEGGGIANYDGGVVSVDGATTFAGNVPDACYGTAAC